MKKSFLITGKNMSHLTLLYVAVITLIIGIIFLFVSLNNNSIDKYDEISDLSANKLSLLMEMRKNADYIQIQTFKHALDTSIIEMRKAGVIIDKENARNDSIYEAYRKKIKSRKEQELFNKLTAARNANIETRNKLVQIDYDNGPDLREPIHYQQTVQQPKYEIYQDAITALSNFLINDTNTKVKNVDVYIFDSRIVIYGSLVILFILLIVLGNTIKITLQKLKLQNDELFYSKESIEDQKQFSESILSAAPDGIIGIDDGGAIVIFNKQAEHIFGYNAEEIIGKELSILVPGQFRKDHPRFVEKYFQSPGDRPISNREAQLFAQRKNGEIFPTEISLSFINNQHKKIAIAGIKDITKRKETEKRLQQLADINKYSKAFVGISTIDRKIIYINDSFRNALGIKPDVDISLQSTYMVYPENIREHMQVVFKEVLEKGLWVGENEILSADGIIIPVAQTIVLHKDEHGQPEFTSSTMIDITEVKQKEKELVRLNKLHRALGDATRLLLNINTREELYNKVCEIIVEIGNLKLSWIGEFNHQTMLVDALGMGGEAKRYLQDITIPVDVPKDKMGPTALAISEGTKQITNDFFATEITKQWQDKAREFKLAASAVFPIRLHNQVIGTLNVYAATKDYFQEEEIHLLQEMATVVSIGVLKLEEEKERLLVEEQKKQLSEIIEHTNALVSMSDMDNNFIYINKAGKVALGVHDNEALNTISVFEILSPASRELVINTIIPALEAHDIWSGEVELISRNGTVIPAMLVTVQHRDEYGVPTHRSNTTIDLTEQKRLQFEATKLSGIIKKSNALIGIANPDFTVNYMNDAMRDKYGMGLEEDLSSINISTLIPPETLKIYNEVAFPALMKEGKWKGEVEWMHRDGRLFTVAMVNEVHKNDEGNIEFISTNAIDITELKNKEKELKQLVDIIENSNAFIGLADMNSQFMYLNKSVRNAFELLPDEKINDLKVFDFHTVSAKEKLTKIGDALRDKGVWTGETEMLSKTGKIIPTLQVVMLHKDKEGNPECYSTTAIDISEIKEKEKDLKKFAEIIEHSTAFIAIANFKRELVYMNTNFKNVLGIDISENISSLSAAAFYTENSKAQLHETMNTLMEDGVWSGESEMITRSGKILPIMQVLVLHKDTKGNPEFISTTAIDISEIKEKEKEHKQLFEILEHSTSLVGIAKMDGTITFLNENFKNTLGITEQEDISCIHLSEFSTDESKGLLASTLQIVLEKGIWVGENVVKARDGRVVHLYQEIMLHYDENGEPEYTSTTAIDISAIKEKEKENKQLADIIANSQSFVGIANKDKKIHFMNQGLRAAIGFEPDEDLTNYSFAQYVTQKSLDDIINIIVPESLKNGLWRGEMEFLSKKGIVIPTYAVHVNHFNDLGELEYTSINAIDITEIKQKEKELEKLSGIIEYAPSYAGIAKMDGAIEYMNNSLKKALEIDETDTASTLKLFDFLTTDSAKQISEVALQKVMQDGIWQGQSEWKSKNDKTIPVIQSIMLHTNQEGMPEYISTTAIDISEIKEKENELQKLAEDLRSLYNHLQTIREEERKTIAKELHDELGQNLTALKLNVAWITKHIDGDREKLNERLQLFEQVTNDTVTTSRRLYNNLYPQMLDDVGVAGAIRWHTNSYKSTTTIDIEFNTNINEANETMIAQPIALALFRIYQECFTNILRYANANLVVLNLHIQAGEITLTIEDDGKGFEIDKVDTKLHHGLLGMRERAHALNGKLSISSSPGKGTTTSVTIPLG